MLTQNEADYLIQLPKKLTTTGSIGFPIPNSARILEASSLDGRTKFLFDINRKGLIKPTKCTYQKRYRKDIILIRLDIDGPDHINPDGEEVPCPHVHIYREDFEAKWAIPMPSHIFSNSTDLLTTLMDFLHYCNIINAHELRAVQGDLI